jgi:hypothetical protein
MPAAGVVMIIAVVAIVAAVVVYLLGTIAAAVEITGKSEPVAPIVESINANLDAGVDLLEGLLVKKAGLADAVGLVDGIYPGAAAQGLRNVPESTEVRPPRIGEVYTRGTLTLARLGREAPIAAASPNGPALRNPVYGSLAARGLYPDGRPGQAQQLPRSPVIGADSPVQYDPGEEVGGPRRRLPAAATSEGS